MAEALAFVGGASALITISKDFLRAGKKLRYYGRTLKHAKEEIKAVEVDTMTCGNILVLFNNALEEDSSPMAAKIRNLEIDRNLQKRSSSLLQKIQMILEKRLRPMSKKHNPGALQRRAAQCMWLFQKSEINETLNELERVKASVQMCMGLVIYAALKNKASQMAVIPPELDDRL
ncbi:uncharacterized protein LTHEOB_4015 [Lasiodiplodia theobromae]|uniref:uncharacterized protein n=1 Tax=Lasiodiplodia theobromae TaxID=45133 RepID=UPI0015C37FEA|nr:uncharacterized protein LTHEOB_4015 [Lasiodiplodia theobromae]KAF4546707.1 hypothetical protein LTHEOB_4015 [Lasiodiplodia theobromae]